MILHTGIKIAEINRAEGERQAAILKSEAQREAQINVAKGEANAIIARAQAKAESLEMLSKAIGKQVYNLLLYFYLRVEINLI